MILQYILLFLNNLLLFAKNKCLNSHYKVIHLLIHKNFTLNNLQDIVAFDCIKIFQLYKKLGEGSVKYVHVKNSYGLFENFYLQLLYNFKLYTSQSAPKCSANYINQI